MADILKVYTSQQLYELFRNKILADSVGLTDFNQGSKVRSLLESNSDLIGSISMDFKEGLYNAIPIALYQGFGFPKLTAVSASGYIRPYRKPTFWIKYIGSGTSALITSTATQISAAVVGAPGDAFTLTYGTYPTTALLSAAINAFPNWEATLIKSVPSTSIYQYTSQEAYSGSLNYLYEAGFDVMLSTDLAIDIIAGFSVSVDTIQILTTTNATISAGTSGVQCLAQISQTGIIGNISINAIDTLNGKGFINSSVDGVEQCINDAAFSGGSDEETDTQRKQRFSETVNALNAGTGAGIIAAIKAVSGVRSVGIRSAYPFKGANTIIVDTGTGTISAPLLAEIEKVLYGDPNDLTNYPGKNCEGIEYAISVPTIVDVNVGITIYRLPTINVDLITIQVDVQTAIEQYINTRKLGEDVLLSEIIRVSKNSNAAVYDAVITSPVANISIDKNEFAKTGAGTGGTVTVTMVIATNV